MADECPGFYVGTIPGGGENPEPMKHCPGCARGAPPRLTEGASVATLNQAIVIALALDRTDLANALRALRDRLIAAGGDRG